MRVAFQNLAFAVLLATGSVLPAQTFNSGSNESDGDLTLTEPGIVLFDPKKFSPALDPDGDGVYHFKTITIGAGVTVKLRGDIINTPVVRLASGAVQINGTIDANGENSFSAPNTTQRRLSLPGAGGYGGGYPAVGGNPEGPGFGPAAGEGRCPSPNTNYSRPGGNTVNSFGVPLQGGSGGAAYGNNSGGAGGGAILIASSTSILGTGAIGARGGEAITNGQIGVGAGGTIRLVAPTISLTGHLDARGGPNRHGACGVSVGNIDGIVRVEAFQIGSLNVTGRIFTATPYSLFLTSGTTPSLRVTSIDGVPVATSPTGSFAVPDVVVNSNSSLPVTIEATNVPVGTIVTLTIFSENGQDQTIQSTGLAGTLAQSTATATVTLPAGFSKGFVTAKFLQP